MKNAYGRKLTPMTDRAWIVGELERLVNELKKNPAPQTPSNAGGGGAPSSSAGGGVNLGAWKRAKVTFWNVEEKTSARGPFTTARVGLSWVENGERKSQFLSTLNRDLIMRIDPLEKGVNVEYTSATNAKGYEDLTDLRVTGR
jgi:hypothetical protein